MHSQINASGKQRLFDFFYKKTFAANFGKGHVQNLISLGSYDTQFNSL